MRSMMYSSARKKISLVYSFILCLLMLTGIVCFSLTPITRAEGDSDASDTIRNSIPGNIDKSPEGFGKYIANSDNYKTKNIDNNSFGYLFGRVYLPSYINNVSQGVATSGQSKPSSGFLCDNREGEGTPVYHNCDIPNMTGEVLQDLFSSVFKTGFVSSEKQKVTTAWGLGVPPLPEEKIPLDVKGSPYKYTGLELFGYNLRFSHYLGEWDHIKTMSSVRMMSNFGAYDSFRLGVSSVSTSVISGFDKGTNQAIERFKNFDILGGIGGFFTGFAEGALTGGVNTLLDSSDLNIVNNKGWYRVNYGSTLYGQRELNNLEISTNAHKMIADYIAYSGKPDEAQLSEETQKMQAGPPALKVTESQCIIHKKDGSQQEIILENKDKNACETYFNNAQPSDSNFDHVEFKEGSSETYDEYIHNNSAFFDYMNKRFPEGCSLPKEGDLQSNVEKFRSCWAEKMPEIIEKELNDTQDDLFNRFIEKLTSLKNLVSFLSSSTSMNFNAPENRFVCVDNNGNDILQPNGDYTYAYNSHGQLHEGCSQARPPIQNGLFGNGYEKNQVTKAPETDTRHFRNVATAWDLLSINFFSGLAQSALDFAGNVTMVSNTILSFVATPILHNLGLDTILITFIKNFRDGVFYPLALFAIAGGALYVFINAIRKQAFKESFVSILLICLTFASGVIIMNKPEKMIQVVDDLPSAVESTVLGTIFTTSNKASELCSATPLKNSKVELKDLDGNIIGSSFNDNIRQLMCENWQAFVLSPWVYGQWGTSIENLYSSGSGRTGSWTNTNTHLVGDASVYMGGGQEIKNWGVYQLAQMASGNITQESHDVNDFGLSRNMYRIVDAQAGPHNGYGTDSRFFHQWSVGEGQWLSAYSGAVSSLFGLAVVAVYSIGIIEAKLMCTLLLIAMPFMFLVGLIPGQGRNKLQQYVFTLVALMAERIALVVLLAIMFRIVMEFATSTTTFLLKTMFIIGVCLTFLLYRSSLIGMIKNVITGGTSAFAGFESGRSFRNKFSSVLPTSVKNKVAQVSATARGATAGAIAGMAAGSTTQRHTVTPDGVKKTISRRDGIFTSALKGARQGGRLEGGRTFNKERRSGLGFLISASQAREAGRESAKNELKNSLDNTRKRLLRERVFPKGMDNEQKKQWMRDFDAHVDIALELYSQDNPRDFYRMSHLASDIYELEEKIDNLSTKQKQPSQGMLVDETRVQKEGIKLQESLRKKQEEYSILEDDMIKDLKNHYMPQHYQWKK